MKSESDRAMELEVEALACALLVNLVMVHDVISWADGWILQLPAPPYALLTVAETSRRHPLDVVSLLRELARAPRDAETLRYVLHRFGQILRESPKAARQIARALYEMALTEEWPDDGTGSRMYSFDDELDLACSGVYGDPKDVVRELQAYLDRAGE